MKYFLDTEFLEGPQQEKFPISLFRKQTPNTIDLISIGIVAEDGREYYAISKDFNLDEAWNRFQWDHELGSEPVKNYWIRENVLKPIWIDLFLNYESEWSLLKGKAFDLFEQELKSGEHDHLFSFKSFSALVNRYGKTNLQIAKEIKVFTLVENFSRLQYENGFKYGHKKQPNIGFDIEFSMKNREPEFYAYYADYDWVVFCWLFGKMMDLPEGFPMYCRDLKQMLDEKAKSYIRPFCIGNNEEEIEKMADRSVKGQVESFKTFDKYPKQQNDHNALADAKRNKELFNFLKSV